MRLDDAEFVAFGIGEHHLEVGGALADVDRVRAQCGQPLDRLALIVARRCRQIEVDPVLVLLRSGTGPEANPERGVVGR